MVLEGGVAGAQPLHKGGRLRPTAHITLESDRIRFWLQGAAVPRGRELATAELLPRAPFSC